MQILITDLIAALDRIPIPNNRCKRLCRSLTVLFRQQAFSLLVLRFLRHAICFNREIPCRRSVVVARRNHRFALGVLRILSLCLSILVFTQRLKCRNGFVILPVLRHLDRRSILNTRNNHQFSNRRNCDNRRNRNHCNRYVSSTSSLLRLLLVHPFLSELFAHLRLFPTVLVIAQSSKAPSDFSVMEI